MEVEALRSKREIVRDIELSRKEMKRSWRGASYAVKERNPAVRAWKATRKTAERTKDKLVVRGLETNEWVQSHIYTSLAVAGAFGMILGLLLKRQKRASNQKCC